LASLHQETLEATTTKLTTSALLTKLSHKNNPVPEGPQQLMMAPFPVYIDHRKMIIFEKLIKNIATLVEEKTYPNEEKYGFSITAQ
jgi:hypothetical protein